MIVVACLAERYSQSGEVEMVNKSSGGSGLLRYTVSSRWGSRKGKARKRCTTEPVIGPPTDSGMPSAVGAERITTELETRVPPQGRPPQAPAHDTC